MSSACPLDLTYLCHTCDVSLCLLSCVVRHSLLQQGVHSAVDQGLLHLLPTLLASALHVWLRHRLLCRPCQVHTQMTAHTDEAGQAAHTDASSLCTHRCLLACIAASPLHKCLLASRLYRSHAHTRTSSLLSHIRVSLLVSLAWTRQTEG